MNKIGILLSLSVAAIFSVSVAFAASKQYQALAVQLVGEAKAALTAKKSDKADTLANLALTADPSNAAAYVVKARAQEAKGNSEQSLRLVTTGLDIEPNNVAALDFQGTVALKLDNLEQVETTLKNLQTVCGDKCPETGKLKTALAKAQTEKTKKPKKQDK